MHFRQEGRSALRDPTFGVGLMEAEMGSTLYEKQQSQWIAIGALVAAALLFRFLELDVVAIPAFLLAVGILVWSVLPTWFRSIAGQETAEEAAARAEQRVQGQEKFAAIEKVAADSTDEKARSKAEADLLWKYMRAWQKSNVPIPNAVVEGWRSRPVDIEDGDFDILAKERDLKKAIMARDPKKWGKSFTRDIRKTEESVEKWRAGVEEIRAGKRQGPDHFDAEDYLRRLDKAFPRSSTGSVPEPASKT